MEILRNQSTIYELLTNWRSLITWKLMGTWSDGHPINPSKAMSNLQLQPPVNNVDMDALDSGSYTLSMSKAGDSSDFASTEAWYALKVDPLSLAVSSDPLTFE